MSKESLSGYIKEYNIRANELDGYPRSIEEKQKIRGDIKVLGEQMETLKYYINEEVREILDKNLEIYLNNLDKGS